MGQLSSMQPQSEVSLPFLVFVLEPLSQNKFQQQKEPYQVKSKSQIDNLTQFSNLSHIYIFLLTFPLMLLLFCVTLILQASHSIRFNYNLPKYQIQCFHQSVEKDSRYQITTKGETSLYYLHVVENEAVHEDSRSKNAQFKQYSAFANSSTIITFCLGNLGDQSIYFDVQFYHGIFLEDSFETNVQGRELQDLSDRWVNMIKMVESNYDIYKRHLFGRRSSSKRITTVLSAMVVIIIVGTALVKVVYYRKITAFLKAKKVV